MRIDQLSNRIKIVYDNLDLFGTISFGIFIGKGSKHENENEHGITHFIEHMLFKSNISFQRNASIENIEKRGGLLNGFTTKEFMCIHTKALKSEIKPIISILFDMFFSPLFLNDEINLEKKVISNEIVRNSENKYNQVHERVFERLYNGHPLSRNILGTWESISKFDNTILSQYHKKMLQSSDIVVAISGQIDKELIAYIERIFGSLSRDISLQKPLEKLFPQVEEDIIIKEKNAKQNYLCIGYPTFSYSHPRLLSLMVFNQFLGGGRTSLLMKNIRGSLGAVYSLGSKTYLYSDGGLLSINLSSSSNNDIFQLKNIILELLRNNLEKELTHEQVAIAKAQLKSKMLYSLENCTSRMLEFGKNTLLNIGSENTENVNFNDSNSIIRSIENINRGNILDIHEEILGFSPTISMITNE